MRNKIIIEIVIALCILAGAVLIGWFSVFSLHPRVEKLEELELRILSVQEESGLKMYIQWWDGEEWRDAKNVDNEDLED